MSRRTARAVPAAALVLTATLALTGCGSSSGSAGSAVTAVDGVKHIGVDAFASLASTPTVVVLDVRTPAEFATGHLPNAVNVDFNAGDFAAQVHALDHAKTYAVYCHSGNRSGQALEVMKADGFGHVADLEGGITAWTGAGQAVVTS
ncbi:MAG: rhodanese-like domain-containing protein [Actinobacteria bacterium]|nr:rhodanese-like domain-containing protein [Actinomycetota bacterium]